LICKCSLIKEKAAPRDNLWCGFQKAAGDRLSAGGDYPFASASLARHYLEVAKHAPLISFSLSLTRARGVFFSGIAQSFCHRTLRAKSNFWIIPPPGI